MSIPLPAPSESVLCADFARDQRIDPRGSGLTPEVVVLVEVPEPWPKPVRVHPDLVELCRISADHHERVRLLAAVPHDPDRRRVIAFRPAPGGMTRAECELGDDAASGLRDVLAVEPRPIAVGSGPRTVLVCTQGSHDVCCGVRGVELADWAEAELPELELFRVSHTGGHRFAPTAMTLPDGRMWAFLDEPLLAGIVSQSVPAADAAAHSRGWWGARGGPAQVAEAAVFAEVGWSLDGIGRTTAVQRRDDGGATAVVETADRSWTVEIEPGRLVPTVACGAPGGLPVKQVREWRVTGIAST